MDYPGGNAGAPLASAGPSGTPVGAVPGTVTDTGISLLAPVGGAYEDRAREPHLITDFRTFEYDTGPGINWFELIHYTPERIDLGNILTTVTREAEIYNSFRRESQTILDATNNAGGGIEFDGLPSLPAELASQAGIVYDIVVAVDGPPTILGTLDFETDAGDFSIPITGSRVVMFAWQPETGIIETLEWKTDILVATDGTEQRIAWRKNPRQQISMTVRIPEGRDRRRMMSLLKGWHPRVFGVPIWWEAQALQAAASAGATTISLDTSNADYRAGGLVIVWSDPDTFDAIEIDAVNPTSLELTSPLADDYLAGETLVMPLRVAQLGQTIPIQRYLTALQDVKLDWIVRDNDVGDSFADTTAFSSHNSKVLLDGYNVADGPIPDDLFRKIYIDDSEVGPFNQFSDWRASVPITQKQFYGGTREAIWNARRLVHALRGSQVSFYLPTFYQDLIPTEGLTAGSADLRVENVGYTDYVQGDEPFVSIWIELEDGTILTREVTDATVESDDVEILTVGTNWASDIDLADISRISLLRLVRIADDRVEFVHEYPGTAQIRMSVRGAP